MNQPALFLDRDGVVNQEVGYLFRPADVRFMDGIFALCRTAQELGFRLIIVTNQSGIAREYYSVAQFEELMQWMRGQFADQGITLDGIYYCPFHPEHGIGQFRREHEDRKPSPGMLLRAAREHGLDLSRSILVGDRCSDIAAASAAKLRRAFLIAGTEVAPCPGDYQAVEQLAAVEDWLRTQA